MSVDRLERVNALLRREIGEAMFHIFASDEMDLSAITVTRVETSRNLRHAKVFVSLRDLHHERGTVLQKLHSKNTILQSIINKNCHLKYTPKLEFILDTSIEKGDRVLNLLSNLDIPADGQPEQTAFDDEQP